ncbi:lysophospholipase, putative [Plasmodium reichenowi]|uniref:Lysophospholipase, putative n=1 Tax=Plasmodium reichenowi TaxID=5854 RepID=A0A060RMR2_PLARE|nr:lysophospholipase, putative [Plasmodium reichenowi]SOV74878.1 lysophospholipase, putative [Plasmodium reichenowi]
MDKTNLIPKGSNYNEYGEVVSGVDTFYNKCGLSIKNYSWIVKEAIAIIILVHGLGSCLRFGFLRHSVNIVDNMHATLIDSDNFYIYKNSWIEEFNKNGYSVYGIDLQGHGESDGIDNLRLHINDFDDFSHDVIDHIKKVYHSIMFENDNKDNLYNNNKMESMEKKIPMYLMGYSMGGNIVLRTLEILGKSKDLISKYNIKGAICISAMVSVKLLGYTDSFKYRYFYLPGARLLATLFPTYRQKIGSGDFKKFPYVNDIISLDSGTFRGNKTNKFAYEIVKSLDTLHKHMDDIPRNIPILFIHARNDSHCYYEGLEIFYNKLVSDNKELVTLENNEHLVIMEPGNEKILKKILDWISKIFKKDEHNNVKEEITLM